MVGTPRTRPRGRRPPLRRSRSPPRPHQTPALVPVRDRQAPPGIPPPSRRPTPPRGLMVALEPGSPVSQVPKCPPHVPTRAPPRAPRDPASPEPVPGMPLCLPGLPVRPSDHPRDTPPSPRGDLEERPPARATTRSPSLPKVHTKSTREPPMGKRPGALLEGRPRGERPPPGCARRAASVLREGAPTAILAMPKAAKVTVRIRRVSHKSRYRTLEQAIEVCQSLP